jgi:ABC-2 type transport system permease protein
MWTQSLEVARWEFRRFVKPKQLLLSFVLTLVMGGAGYFASDLAERNARSSARIAVIGGEGLALDRTAAAVAPPTSRADSAARAAGPRHQLTFEAHPASAGDSLRAAVAAKQLDALLVVRGDRAELTVRRDPPWRSELAMRLTAARQAARLQEARLAAATLAELLAPVAVEVRHADPARGRGGRVVAMVAIAAVLYGVFTGVAYLFVSITGEKQLRVTEQILSAITPQAWIDGKLLGIAGVSLVGVLTLGGAALVFALGRALAAAACRSPRRRAPACSSSCWSSRRSASPSGSPSTG